MSPTWMPKVNILNDQIAEEYARAEELRQRQHEKIKAWMPESISPIETAMSQDITQAQPVWQASVEAPTQTPTWQAPEMPQIEAPETFAPTERYAPTPITPPLPVSQAQKVTPTTIPQPEKVVEPETPLWLKAVNIIGLPFKLVQDYAFNPLLAAIHLPFTRQLNSQELRQANQEGITSYFPGGVRNQAYQDLQYTGKWAVEMLPWLIVPPIGTVGLAGVGGRGIAGALSKIGKAGELAGRALEYSPAGLAEKAIGGVMGALTNRITGRVLPKIKEVTSANAKNIFYHTTNAAPFEKFKATPEIWFERTPQEYGKNAATVEYKWKNPFVTGVMKAHNNPELGVTIEQAAKNSDIFQSLGGETNPKSFEWMRKQGYDVLIDETGVAALYPERVKILNWGTLVEKQREANISKLTNIIREAKTILPEQQQLTKELRQQQFKNAMNALEQGGYGEQGLRAFAAAFKGKAGLADFESIAGKLIKSEKDQLSQMILDFSKTEGNVFVGRQATSGWAKMLQGQLPVDSELEAMQKIFGPELIQALIDKKPGNIINKISDIANAPRSLLAAVDLSYLRQGGILATRFPIETSKTVLPMIRAFYSDKNAQFVDDVIKARPHFDDLINKAKVYFAPQVSAMGITPLSKMEESFMSRFIEKVPIIGSLVKASNRSFITGLNDLRSRAGESILTSWEKLGVTIADNDYIQLGRLINSASGRGSLPQALQGASPLFNAMLFSPRLFISRIQFPTMLVSSSALVRKEAARQLVSFLSAGTAVLGMASLAGAKIEVDPRSSDFGKMRIGNTRLDIWSGYSQWARFLAQLATEQRKTQYGNISEVNRRDLVDRFMQSKYSPAMGLINDLLRGEGYAGESVDFSEKGGQRMAWTRLTPLFIQDMIDAIDQDGLLGGITASPGLFGMGVITYMSPAQKLKEQLSQAKYGMSWDEVGKNLGIATQMELQRSDTKLLAYIQQERDDYNKTISGKADIGNIYRNQTATIENQFKGNVDLASQELRDTGDGYTFKEKMLKLADNRRSQYDILNKDPQFSKIVARYEELPSATDLQKMSPQDWARKEYFRLLYGQDMYDQYHNYRFDMVDDVRELFAQTYGQGMLDYIETYQGIKENELSPEYQEFKKAQQILKPYWGVTDNIAKLFGQAFAESPAGQRLIQSQRRIVRLSTPNVDAAYRKFYTQK